VTRGGNRMRESCKYGSVRGAPSNGRPYRDRREFISLLGGAAAAWPTGARAQNTAIPIVGYLSAGSSDSLTAYPAVFRRSLAEAGYVEGQNVEIEYRWAGDQPDRLLALATELQIRIDASLMNAR
jgi:hypothetical protein